jgi:hypothetical protein
MYIYFIFFVDRNNLEKLMCISKCNDVVRSFGDNRFTQHETM